MIKKDFLRAKRLQRFFEKEQFNVHLFEQNNEQCAEIEKWTNGGVDMIFTLRPFTKESFIEIVSEFDIDEEIDLHRQDKEYCQAFRISESLKDFTDFHEDIKKVSFKLSKRKLL